MPKIHIIEDGKIRETHEPVPKSSRFTPIKEGFIFSKRAKLVRKTVSQLAERRRIREERNGV